MADNSPVKAEFRDVVVMEAGDYEASTGKVSFSAADIADIAATPIPSGGFPVIIGHEAENDDAAPAVGFDTGLRVNPDNPAQLLCSGVYNDKDVALQTQEGGAYSRRSPGLVRKEGKWRYQHRAVLGAKDPANPNLPGVKAEQMVYLSSGSGKGETFHLMKAPAPKEDNVANEDTAKLAKERDDLKAQLAAAEAKAEAAEKAEQDAKAQLAAKDDEDGKLTARLAVMERESRNTQAEKYIASLDNLKTLPAVRASALVVLSGLVNNDDKVRLSGAKADAAEVPLVEAFKAHLAGIMPGPGLGLHKTGPAVALDADYDTQINQRVKAYMKANKGTDYDTALLAVLEEAEEAVNV